MESYRDGRPLSDPSPSPAERLLALFDGHRLSPAQRRIAQYLLDHLPESALLSSVDLAVRAGVSQPSVTRFAVALGYPGYPALRAAMQPIVLGASGPADSRRNDVQTAVAAELRHLETLQQSLADPGAVLDLGRELAASAPLAVLGLRVSAALAHYFGYAAQRIHSDVRTLTTGGGLASDALLQARDAGGVWLLAFVLPRYPADAVRALRFARKIGLKTAVVTDVPFVPFAADADVLLPVGVGTRLVFDSYAAPMVLAAVLLQAMADADGARTRARLAAYEEIADEQGYYYG